MVEHVQLGDEQGGQVVDRVSVAQQGDVEPAATPRTSGHRPVLGSGLPEIVSRRPMRFCHERALADTRGVSLGHSHDVMQESRRNARSRAQPAGGGVRRGQVGVCAEVDVEHRGLGPLEEQALSVLDRLVEVLSGFGHERAHALGEFLVAR